MRPSSPILDMVVRAEFHVLLIVSVYLLFAGHNGPGGGSWAVWWRGRPVPRGTSPEARPNCVGPSASGPPPCWVAGLIVALATAFLSLVNDGGFLQHRLLKVEVPFIGPVKSSSAFFFDFGVYLVVLGTVLVILAELGAPSEDER